MALFLTREYDADLNAARRTGDPDGLASALARIERLQGRWWERVFLAGRRLPDPWLLRTHPSSLDRIARFVALKPRTLPPAGSPVESGGFDPADAFGRSVR